MKASLAPLALGAMLAATPIAADTINDTPRIAVMSAFAPEWTALQEAMEDRTDYILNGNRFAIGTIEGKEVVLFLTGISMVNAAMTSQLALDHFNITSIVFSGIAGGVDPARHVGDVVVPTQWVQYLEMIFARQVGDRYVPPAFLQPAYPNFGMMFPQNIDVNRDGAEGLENRFWFPVDPDLLAVAEQVADSIALEECVEVNACLSHVPRVYVGGNGVSGAAFVDNTEFREYAFETFDATVLDMESAAVAHVAYANKVPFIAIRSLSDLAGGSEGENELGTFFQLASDNSATVVRAFLAALPE